MRAKSRTLLPKTASSPDWKPAYEAKSYGSFYPGFKPRLPTAWADIVRVGSGEMAKPPRAVQTEALVDTGATSFYLKPFHLLPLGAWGSRARKSMGAIAGTGEPVKSWAFRVTM